jgi:CheY-like chemotaxis protein
MKLLIVEDNQPMRRLIRSLLADLTDSIAECGDGAEAYASYAEHRPDWVLMDLMMPQVDGLAATREILASYPAARIVIVTDHESHTLRQAAQSAGACGYVLKENLQDLRGLFSATAREFPAGV